MDGEVAIGAELRRRGALNEAFGCGSSRTSSSKIIFVCMFVDEISGGLICHFRCTIHFSVELVATRHRQ